MGLHLYAKYLTSIEHIINATQAVTTGNNKNYSKKIEKMLKCDRSCPLWPATEMFRDSLEPVFP